MAEIYKSQAGRLAVERLYRDVLQRFRPRMEPLPIRTDEELAALTMPVQLILGGEDALIRSRETRDRMKRQVPHVHLTYLEHEGHILPRQTTAISEFLSAVTGAVV